MSIEGMKMAVEALEDTKPYRAYPPDHTEIIAALRAAIAEAEKAQPVGKVYRYGRNSAGQEWHGINWLNTNVNVPDGTLLYTHPAPQEKAQPFGWACRGGGEEPIEDGDRWTLHVGQDAPELAWTHQEKIPLYTHPPSAPRKLYIPPAPADALEVVYVEGWNAACDTFFGGHPPAPAVVIETSAPAPSAPLTSEGRRQIIYALERQIKALRDHADKLAGSDDPYQAEFPAEDADRLSEAVLHLIATAPKVGAPLLTDKDFDDIMDRYKDAPSMEWRYLVGRAIESRVREGK